MFQGKYKKAGLRTIKEIYGKIKDIEVTIRKL